MGFYYFSIFSIVPLSIAYGALALLYWALVRGTRGMRARWALLGVAAPVFLALPIAEEWWIAWNFGQACKEAGTFIHKKVQVDGFYDDTTHWWRQLAESSSYRFVESRDNSNGNLWRVERNGIGVKHFRIDRPTARYHYKWLSHVPQTHKVVKHEATVTDSATNEILGRELNYGRHAPWYFIGLDAPIKICVGKRDVRGMLYENVLLSPNAGNERGKK
jgi:hypothetical protein